MTPSYESAFDKLVDVSMKQTEIMTKQSMLLENLIEKFDVVSEQHNKNAEATRVYLKDVVVQTAAAADLWWKRALIAFCVIIFLGEVLSGTPVNDLLLKLIGLGK